MASIVEHNAYLSNGDVFIGAIDIIGEGNIRMPNTYIMHWLDTLNTFQWTRLYKQYFEHAECN
jgi:hypothetical protein